MKITFLLVLLLVLKAISQPGNGPNTGAGNSNTGSVEMATNITLNVTVETTTQVNVTEVVTTQENVTETISTEINITATTTVPSTEFNNTEFNNTETTFNNTEMNSTSSETSISPSGLSAAQLNSSCIYGTLLFNGYCACWSGAYGTTCEMGLEQVTCGTVINNPWDNSNNSSSGLSLSYLNLDSQPDRDFCMDISGSPSCPLSSWGQVLPLSTHNPPTLDSATFQNNSLNILISQPMVNGRADGAVFLNSEKLYSQFPFCSYPLSEYIFKQVDGCKDQWNFSIPWNEAIQCGWTQVQEEGYKTYRGQIIVHNHEWLQNINEFRFIQSVLRIKIRFQVFVAVSFESFVYSSPNLRSGITQQVIAVNLGEEAIIQLTTLINYPYMLSNGSLILFPQGKVENDTITTTDTTCSGTGDCKQRWNIALFLNNDTCTLDGAYRMNFTETCSDTSINCPLEGYPVAIDFSLVSENFCAQITIDIGLYGSIKVYSGADFTTIQSSFIQNRTAYFLVTVSSDQNQNLPANSTANILFSSVTLETVTLRIMGSSNNILRLFQNGSAADNTYDSNIQAIQRSLGNEIGFSFMFSDSLVSALNATIKTQITVGAEVLVVYNNGGSSTKRGLMAGGGQEKTSFATTNELDSNTNNNNNENSNIGSVLLGSLLLVLMSMLF